MIAAGGTPAVFSVIWRSPDEDQGGEPRCCRPQRRVVETLSAVLAVAFAAGCASLEEVSSKEVPLVIAHRGASGERPEHTLEAYRVAIEAGADFGDPPQRVVRKAGTIETRAMESGDGTLTATVPLGVAPGEHRVVLVLDEKAPGPAPAAGPL